MTADLSFYFLVASVPLSLIFSGILIWGALQRPAIRFLILMAVISIVISALLTAYVWAVGNAALGYIVPKELAQTVLRILFDALPVCQLGFIVLFATGKVRDAPTGCICPSCPVHSGAVA